MKEWRQGLPRGVKFRSVLSNTFGYHFIAKEKQECANAAFYGSLCKISKFIVAPPQHTVRVSSHSDDTWATSNLWWISEGSESVTALCLRVASSLLQGPGGAEEVLCPDPSQCQQIRVQHSFVQEHFQAQYKWVSSLNIPHTHTHACTRQMRSTTNQKASYVLVTSRTLQWFHGDFTTTMWRCHDVILTVS